MSRSRTASAVEDELGASRVRRFADNEAHHRGDLLRHSAPRDRLFGNERGAEGCSHYTFDRPWMNGADPYVVRAEIKRGRLCQPAKSPLARNVRSEPSVAG